MTRWCLTSLYVQFCHLQVMFRLARSSEMDEIDASVRAVLEYENGKNGKGRLVKKIMSEDEREPSEEESYIQLMGACASPSFLLLRGRAIICTTPSRPNRKRKSPQPFPLPLIVILSVPDLRTFAGPNMEVVINILFDDNGVISRVDVSHIPIDNFKVLFQFPDALKVMYEDAVKLKSQLSEYLVSEENQSQQEMEKKYRIADALQKCHDLLTVVGYGYVGFVRAYLKQSLQRCGLTCTVSIAQPGESIFFATSHLTRSPHRSIVVIRPTDILHPELKENCGDSSTLQSRRRR